MKTKIKWKRNENEMKIKMKWEKVCDWWWLEYEQQLMTNYTGKWSANLENYKCRWLANFKKFEKFPKFYIFVLLNKRLDPRIAEYINAEYIWTQTSSSPTWATLQSPSLRSPTSSTLQQCPDWSNSEWIRVNLNK